MLRSSSIYKALTATLTSRGAQMPLSHLSFPGCQPSSFSLDSIALKSPFLSRKFCTTCVRRYRISLRKSKTREASPTEALLIKDRVTAEVLPDTSFAVRTGKALVLLKISAPLPSPRIRLRASTKRCSLQLYRKPMSRSEIACKL